MPRYPSLLTCSSSGHARSPLPYITLRRSSTVSCHPCHPLPSRLAIVDLPYQFGFPFPCRLFLPLPFFLSFKSSYLLFAIVIIFFSFLFHLFTFSSYHFSLSSFFPTSFSLSSFPLFFVSLFGIVLYPCRYLLPLFVVSSYHLFAIVVFPCRCCFPVFALVVLTLSPRSPHFIFPRRRVPLPSRFLCHLTSRQGRSFTLRDAKLASPQPPRRDFTARGRI